MNLAEPYPSSPSGGSIQDQITSYLSGLVPAGAVDSGICAFFTVVTVILAALGYHHLCRQKWLNGWFLGPASILMALISASYGVSGLPALFGVDSFARDPKALLVDGAVALLAAALVAGAAWPVAVHASAYRGSPITLADLREWVLQGDRLHAGGGAAAGAAVGWIVLGPLTCVTGAVLGLLVAATVVTLRTPAVLAAPAAPPAHPQPPAAPPHAPVPPVVSDEGW